MSQAKRGLYLWLQLATAMSYIAKTAPTAARALLCQTRACWTRWRRRRGRFRKRSSGVLSCDVRIRQSALLNSIENLIRARKFDENNLAPWTSALSLGVDSNETSINQFDDVDDFNNYN